ncbi:hypothetical protein [uncultured Anaerovibrio sp.]|jgi:hypothetical protein|uniref:hypothetical protein n=1 Tax=uncultured Anaerovibrio sp. TaxID=361586 RepID=UPI0026110731|nr:hypothetical protein [uncultured Anaerovibrio sp.]
MNFELKLMESYNDGLSKGIIKGENAANRRTAMRMIKAGEPMEKIIQYTSLSEEEIQVLVGQAH